MNIENPNVIRGHKANCASITGYKGVSFDKRRKLYRARITKNGKVELIGWFETPENAAIAYNKRAKALYGEHAYKNVIAPKTQEAQSVA